MKKESDHKSHCPENKLRDKDEKMLTLTSLWRLLRTSVTKLKLTLEISPERRQLLMKVWQRLKMKTIILTIIFQNCVQFRHWPMVRLREWKERINNKSS